MAKRKNKIKWDWLIENLLNYYIVFSIAKILLTYAWLRKRIALWICSYSGELWPKSRRSKIASRWCKRILRNVFLSGLPIGPVAWFYLNTWSKIQQIENETLRYVRWLSFFKGIAHPSVALRIPNLPKTEITIYFEHQLEQTDSD